MIKKPSSIILLFPVSLILLFFVSCGPAVVAQVETPTPSPTSEILVTPTLVTETPTTASICPAKDWPCPSDSLTLTAEIAPTLTAMPMQIGTSDSLTMTAEMAPTLAAMQVSTRDSLTMTAEMGPTLDSNSMTMTQAMGWTLAAIPSSTSLAGAIIVPSVGDLGWGSVYGIIRDGITNLPIEGATIRCAHFSYISQYPCSGVTTTNSDGIYSFTSVFFHDTDRITLFVEAPGYAPLHFEQGFFTRPEFHADLGLFPAGGGSFTPTPTLTPYVMCTAPACPGGALTCGNPNGCSGGCGMVCRITTPYLMCTAPACPGGVLACGNPNGCLGGCGTVCRTATPYIMCMPPICLEGIPACTNPNGCPGGCGAVCVTATPMP